MLVRGASLADVPEPGTGTNGTLDPSHSEKGSMRPPDLIILKARAVEFLGREMRGRVREDDSAEAVGHEAHFAPGLQIT